MHPGEDDTRFALQLPPRDAHDAVAQRLQLGVADAVALEGRAIRRPLVAVDLDDHAPVRPEEIHVAGPDARWSPDWVGGCPHKPEELAPAAER